MRTTVPRGTAASTMERPPAKVPLVLPASRKVTAAVPTVSSQWTRDTVGSASRR